MDSNKESSSESSSQWKFMSSLLSFLDKKFDRFGAVTQNVIGIAILFLLCVLALHTFIAPTYIRGRLFISESGSTDKQFASSYLISPPEGNDMITNESGVFMYPIRGAIPQKLRFIIREPGSDRVAGEFVMWEPWPILSALRVSEPELILQKDSHKVEFASYHPESSDLLQSPNIAMVVHLSDIGDVRCDAGWCGTRGEGKQLEGVSIRQLRALPGVQLWYMAHLSGTGDTGWLPEGTFCGTRGQKRAVEAVKIALRGTNSASYSVAYQVYIRGRGDSQIMRDGQLAGTTGQARPIESIKVWIERK